MNLPTKRTVAVGALVTGLALGGAGIAMAADEPAPGGTNTAADPSAESDAEENEAPGTEQDEASETEDGNQDPSYTGSVPAPEDAEDGTETNDGDGDGGGGGEAEESTALQALATTTPQEATAAATAAVPGTAGAVELENENGYVVYSVEVTTADGTTVEVKVDAGNAAVLAQETDDDTRPTTTDTTAV